MRPLPLCCLTVSLLAMGGMVTASERHFTYTHESAVLAPGEHEWEIWTTYRRGREQFYSRMDNRLELEVGVTDRLMTAFYINHKSVTKDDGLGGTTSTSELSGVSWELKYKLSDAVADPVGAALYGEATLGSSEGELELKLILDKRVGDVLVAFNAVYEPEAEFGATTNTYEHQIEADLGATYFVSPEFAFGIEARNHNVIVSGDYEQSAVFVGPALFYNAKSFWVAVTALWQVADLKDPTPGTNLDLDDHERFNGRLIFGTHF